MNHLLAFAGTALLTAPAALAQAPEIIHYTFDSMDASNSASPGHGGAATVGGTNFIASTICAGGSAAESSDPSLFINSGWTLDFGMSDWTVGMIIDQELGGNAFQYYFGAASASSFRCFGNGAAGVDGIMLRSPGGDIVIPGATALGASHQIVFVYDSSVPEIRGYLDGALAVTQPQSALLNLNAGSADFNVMGYTSSGMVVAGAMDEFRVYRRAITQAEVTDWAGCLGGGGGTNYCTAAVNSTGVAASISSSGSTSVATNDFVLMGSSLPISSFAFFITSQTQGFVMMPGGSSGNLCVAGSVGRYVGPGQVQQSNASGEISLAIDLASTPQPMGFVSVQAGETWNFQAWYRDAAGGVPTSNFTDGLEVDFQ